jgi:Ca2+-binding RTX toxin-like protein
MIMGGDSDNDTLDGGEGQDTLSYWSESAPMGGSGLNVTLPEPGDWGTAYLFNGHEDQITGFEHLIGNAFKNDSLIGNSLDNYIQGGGGRIEGMAGNDTLVGSSGYAETIDGGDGNDLIYGLAGDDDLSGGDGNDTIFGGAGNDTIYGDAGNDTLYGGEGNDTIYGGSGDDVIMGGLGADNLWGGAGADVFVFSSFDATLGLSEDNCDTINDYELGIDSISTGIPGSVSNFQKVDYLGGGDFASLANDAVSAFDANPDLKYYYADNVGADSYLIINWEENRPWEEQSVMLVDTTGLEYTDIV